MKFEIRSNKEVVGLSDLEYGDPPMGFAHGELKLVADFNFDKSDLTLNTAESKDEVPCQSIDVENVSNKADEPLFYVTICVDTSETYEAYFKEHIDGYEQ